MVALSLQTHLHNLQPTLQDQHVINDCTGGSLLYEHKNLGRKGQQLAASVNAQVCAASC
jgi:hypothetical protein